MILDSYSLIKYYYQHGFPKSDLFEFIDECEDPPEGESYRQVGSTGSSQYETMTGYTTIICTYVFYFWSIVYTS